MGGKVVQLKLNGKESKAIATSDDGSMVVCNTGLNANEVPTSDDLLTDPRLLQQHGKEIGELQKQVGWRLDELNLYWPLS
jgi:hypothetical protein